MTAVGCPALQYGWPEGQVELRSFIATRLAARGCRVATDDILVTSGAQQAIAIATQLAFRERKIIRLDRETYSGALELFRARGLTLTHDVDVASGAYVMPVIDNPCGQSMPRVVRAHLIDRARSGRLFLVEDDAYADIVFEGEPARPLLADAPAQTLYVGTFSKSLCPGLRVGWLIVPTRLRGEALEVKRESDLQANSLAQAILVDFFAHDDFETRIGKARRIYRRRASRLVEALYRRLPEWSFTEPSGGFSIWVDTHETADDATFLAAAVAEGASFDPGSMFRVGRSRSLEVRLSYSFLPEREIDEGVRRLARAWRSLTVRSSSAKARLRP